MRFDIHALMNLCTTGMGSGPPGNRLGALALREFSRGRACHLSMKKQYHGKINQKITGQGCLEGCGI